MPLQGFLAPRDPMRMSTLQAMDRELVSDSLVYRPDDEQAVADGDTRRLGPFISGTAALPPFR